MNEKFKGLKIAFFPSYGHALPSIVECMITALQKCGATVHLIRVIELNGSSCYDQTSLNELLTFQPDYCFFIGQNGYINIADADPSEHFLDMNKLPYVNFMFDFPMRPDVLAIRANTYLEATFIWDRTHAPLLEQLGMKNVNYLPLATDQNFFNPVKKNETPYNISFIGAVIDDKTMTHHCQKLPIELLKKADTLIKAKLNDNNINIYAADIILTDEVKPYVFDFLGYLNARHTSYYRKNMIYHLGRHQQIEVFGNKEWAAADNNKIIVHQGIQYKDIMSVFANTHININLSATHLATSINQRIFDCYGAGEFLISDYKEDLIELFKEDGLELPYFRNKNELLEKVEFFQNKPELRKSISLKAQKIIQKKHTWDNRMQEVLEIITR